MVTRDENGAQTSQTLLLVIGEVVAKRRTMLDMSQADLAKEAGLQRTYISDIERGLRNVTILTLHDVAEALDTTPIELLKESYALFEIRNRREAGQRRIRKERK